MAQLKSSGRVLQGIRKLKKQLSALEKLLEEEPRSQASHDVVRTQLPADEVRKCRFYQFKKSTVEFFYERIGKTEIRVEDTPHYALASALNSGNRRDLASAEEFYRLYLEASWPQRKHGSIPNRIDSFKAHFDHVRGGTEDPSIVTTSFVAGGDRFVVDGNHRAAFAAALGRPVNAKQMAAKTAFARYSKVNTFYGTAARNMPYQSILIDSQIVVPGRRNDAVQRMRLIPEKVIKGRSVLDIASNFGMSSILSKQFGAQSVFGLELTPRLVDLATRFAMIQGAYPSVQFQVFNVDRDSLPQDRKFDTAFMFSLYDHLKNPTRLISLAKNNVAKWVVFEAHPGGTRESYRDFFDCGIFSSVQEIGRLDTSVRKSDGRRPLWLCEKSG